MSRDMRWFLAVTVTLVVLAVIGAVVYGGTVLLLFGPSWLAALRARRRV